MWNVVNNLEIDYALIEAACEIGHHATQEAAVTAALDEYIQPRKQPEFLDHLGTVDFDPDYDYKANRMLDKIECD